MWRNHGITFTNENPPRTKYQARRVIGVLRAAMPEPLGAKTISDLLYGENRLALDMTRHVPDADEELIREELEVLEAIRETPRIHSTYMWLDARIGIIKAELGDVQGARSALEGAIYEANFMSVEPELLQFCRDALAGLPTEEEN